MDAQLSSSLHTSQTRSSERSFSRIAAAFITFFVGGCSAGLAPGTSSPAPDVTVPVLTSSVANDQLSQYYLTVDRITLTSRSGNVVSLLGSPLYSEFIHVNGMPEPLVFARVPPDVYTAATVSLGPSNFSCVTLAPTGSLNFSIFADLSVPAADVSVTLPEPLTIGGSSTALLLNMEVSKSASYPSCYFTGIEPYTLTPAFTLTALELSPAPTNSSNGRLSSLQGIISKIDGTTSTITLTSADGSSYGGINPTNSIDPANGPVWNVETNSSTMFEGIPGPSALAVGMPVEIDAALRSGGVLLATRVAAYDTDPTNTSLWVGPVLKVESSRSRMDAVARLEVGPVLEGGGALPIDTSSAVFKISGQLVNRASLPFQANFSAAKLVAGQNVVTIIHQPAALQSPDGNYVPATTITLIPQTINGTISAVGNDSGFATYTVTLAPYDLFRALAVQSGQASALNNPNTVVVYADGNTQMLNTNPVATGSVMRFYGLVFNDNGTLRMDCAQISDGVLEGNVPKILLLAGGSGAN